MSHLKKCVTVQKNGSQLTNVSHLEKWFTVEIMGHRSRKFLQLKKLVTLKECVTLKKKLLHINTCFIIGKMGHT